jgi:formate/nitrite transporter FocA (FNT family)
MVMLIGLLSSRVAIFELCYNWIVVLLSESNFCACVFTVCTCSYLTQLHAREPYLSLVQGIAKIDLEPEVAFLRAIRGGPSLSLSSAFRSSARSRPTPSCAPASSWAWT